ncbi:MAG: rod shape-determining protein RodA [Candidatus Andersenbacteria bacterium RIFCSPHIGHO2_02_FULL_45_11]|uniref:Rod shape-determining protein RodA n=1 Tax=Candidatus Andersenbacteria bacterium RIFCSPHIGHO2_12_FULL_45_11 TaxID=1797281 RepID=A0A1G1X3S8_9BACT|nr:MAG: rod shape-determining protein RodA [Candidatus Andersenbacteria bacterium RIFCSPHIGHO2_01_FULL_46_36]OGY34658.1 MAG: rod shape-determining protein RodA [Candidatus Andersenbacteria bacterium RIFCSPHIGHO2_12_FULL_45_11]OGY34727.1 MAG: rod shape-determining protein RodA [Candidatus Andersenbacteria bacterium RIFCSPHIGHO2_02_FULL_45_11]
MKLRSLLPSIDWTLVASAALLAGIGLAMLASAADTGGGVSPFLLRQGIAFAVGGALIVIMMKIPYHNWRRIAPAVFGIGLIMQLIVLGAGRIIRGTVSRLDLFGVQVQPSEFVKVALVLVLAWILAKGRTNAWRQFAITAATLALPLILVMQEPDLGMAVLMSALWLGMMIVFGMPWRIVMIVLLIAFAAFGTAWQTVFLDYQKERILTFLNPTADPLGSGYNVTQSIIALGSGQIFGRGLGHGPQSQLKFLPERHTDFILASVGEELGFVGIALVVILYTVLLWRILLVARTTRDPFGQAISVGAFLLLLIGFTVNSGMNMGLLPVTGIPLPFISYGGSNLITSCFLLGLVESVKIHSRFTQEGPGELTSFL